MTAPLRLQLLIEANARAARGEVAATIEDVKKLTGATQASGAAQADAAGDAAKLDAAMTSLRAEIEALRQTEMRAAAALKEMGGAGKGASDQTRAFAAEVTQLQQKLALLEAAERRAAQAIAAEAEAFADLKASVDPAFAAQRAYEQQVEQVTRAVRLGVATQEEANRVLGLARTRMGGVGEVLDDMARSGGQSAMVLRNLAFQGNQVAQMGVVTGNYLGALAIQLPDIFASFGSLPMILAGGALAMGVSFIPALFSTGDAAEEAADRIDVATQAVDAYRGAVEAANRTPFELANQFGAATARGAELLELQRELMRIEAERANGAAMRGVGSAIGYTPEASAKPDLTERNGMVNSEQLALALNQLKALNEMAQELGVSLEDNYDKVVAVADAVAAAEAAADAPSRDQAAALARVQVAIENVVGGSRQMTDATYETVRLLADAEQAALMVAAAEEASLGTVQEKIQELNNEAAVQALINQYGADSAEVAAEQAAQAREAMLAWADAQLVTDEMRASLIAAYDAAADLKAAGDAVSFDAAAESAAAIARNLGVALEVARSLAQTPYAEGLATADDGRGSQREARQGAIAANTARILREQADLPWRQEIEGRLSGGSTRPKARASGGGGRSSAERDTDREAESVERVLDRLREERELLRETNPVQQEMIRLRDELAGATAEQRAEIEGLIRAGEAEQAALEQTRERMEDVREVGRDVLGGMVEDLRAGASEGEVFLNMLDRIADKLADMAVDTFGDVLFGSGSNGGLLGGLLGGLFGGGGGTIAGTSIPVPPSRRFAVGGVVSAPTFFGFGQGQLGLMGEAGPEAILPLSQGGGVGAVMGGQETSLPLVRLASGKLGVAVQPFAMGGAFGGASIEPAPASWRQASRGGASSTSAESSRPEPIRLELVSRVDRDGNITAHVERVAGAVVARSARSQDRQFNDRVRQYERNPKRS